MNARNKSLVIGVIASLAISLSAKAADQSHPCSRLLDDAQRLGCYDGAFGKPRAPDGTAAVTVPLPATAAVVPAAPTSAPAPAPAKPPETYQSPVTALGSTADGRFIASLGNGEFWVQAERNSRIDVKVGDVVTMRRMLLGNYTMGTKNGPAFRVKRVN